MKNKFDRGWKPALYILGLAALFFILAPEVPAQYGSQKEQQAFDYSPNPADSPQLPEKTISADYADAELVNDSIQGVFVVSKHRWKNWTARAVYILILDLALMVILLTLPKTEEFNILIAYVIAGASAVLSFWVLLCAWLLFMLNASAWLAVLPLSLAMAAGTHAALMKIKRTDVSLTELKKSFQTTGVLAKEDPRLASIEGAPGNWSEEDFLK
jgi:hypothetical protein